MKRLNAYFRPTLFAGLRPWQACLVVVAFAMTIVWGVICCEKSAHPLHGSSRGYGSDAALYRSIVRRVHAGESYYDVVVDELRTRRYATRPFFNWRLPLLGWFLGKIPTPELGRWILLSLASVTLGIWVVMLKEDGGFYMAALGGLLLSGMIVCCFPEPAFLFHEVWAGVLIALSIAVHTRSRPLGVASGLLALFVRELTLPFVVVMLLMAHRERCRQEMVAWLLGITAFLLYLAVHAITVSSMLVESDRANDTWIQFGGWSFVLATTKWTLPTFFSPWWVDIVLLPLVLIGVTGWRGAVGKRVAWTIGLYVLAFLVAGRSDNHYWGLMYAPLIPLGLVHAPRSLADLWRAAVGRGRQHIHIANVQGRQQ